MVFIVLFSLIAIACLVTHNGKKRIPRGIVCFLFFLMIQLLLGLRHIQYGGVDTQVYARDFMRIVTQDYSIFDIFLNFYKDFGFYLFARVVGLFTNNMNAWLCVCALPFTTGITRLIYKYSENIFLSFIIFLSYGFYLYNFQLVRHVFALGLIMWAFVFLQEGRKAPFFITVLAAGFCHTIAYVFIGAYFVQKGRIDFKQVLWIIIGGCIALLASSQTVLSFIFSAIPFLGEGRFAQYENRGGSLSADAIIFLLFVLVCWYFMYNKQWKNEELRRENVGGSKSLHRRAFVIRIRNDYYCPEYVNMIGLLNMVAISVPFYALTLAIGESYRLAQYYSIFAIILLPNVLKHTEEKRLAFWAEVVIVAFGLWHFFGGLFVEGSVYNPYVFFWEVTQSLY